MEKEKIKVTSQQLGQVLFVFVLTTVTNSLKNKEVLEDLGVEKMDKNSLFREMIIINMFATIQQFQGMLNDGNLENEVLDYMHEAYYKNLIEQLNFSKEQVTEERFHVLKRYREYSGAMKEKKGPNWLWPLSDRMLNNLRHEETKDAIAMAYLTTIFSELMVVLPEMISKYEIVKNWN